MEFFKNFPLFAIITAFVSVVLCSLLPRKVSRIVCLVTEGICIALGICVLTLTIKNGYFRYSMGHFPAPYDNEIRFGVLEAMFATFFPLIIMLSILGGVKHIESDISSNKEKYIYVLLSLALVALTSLTYTNDIFTGYVFLEISTLSSVGLVMIKEKGNTTIAALRYMIFNLMGSGLFLIGCVLLYDMTGYLSMEYIMTSITTLVEEGTSLPVVTCTFTLITIGLGIKSGLFPFYFWMPDTYGESTTTSACVVSGLISKGYILLLIKFIYRTFGWENIQKTGMINIIFALGVLGMIFGSLSALLQKKINRMVAFSSAAQIGYIYLGIGLGPVGMVGAVFQIFCHAITKPLLFVSSSGIIDASNNKEDFKSIVGAGRNNIIAGIGFVVGSLSMIGFPFFAGFLTKYLLTTGALSSDVSTVKLVFTIIALVASTLLNTAYLLRTCILIFLPEDGIGEVIRIKQNIPQFISIIGLSILNIILGTLPYLIELIKTGLSMLA